VRRRFARIFLNAATVLSVVLCAGVLVLWVRSARYVEGAWYAFGETAVGGSALPGGLRVGFTGGVPDELAWRPHLFSVAYVRQEGGRLVRSFDPTPPGGWLGFSSALRRAPNPSTGRPVTDGWIGVPYWFAAVLFAALPVARVAAAVRDRRRDPSAYCPTCRQRLLPPRAPPRLRRAFPLVSPLDPAAPLEPADAAVVEADDLADLPVRCPFCHAPTRAARPS
jgi:hypothetical protein